MIMAGLVTGARRGIWIRHEYENPKEILQEEIERCYREQLLGPNILGSGLSFDLEIFVSPGGYICGEESALLEAIEGKRAEPRNKPPFPGTNGLWNQPTAINNVETFAFATVILVRGVEWFKAQGKNGSAGMKFVGISGDVNRPGVFEVPMGTKYSELIQDSPAAFSTAARCWASRPRGRLPDTCPHPWPIFRWTGMPWRRPVRWWVPARLWFVARAAACWTWR